MKKPIFFIKASAVRARVKEKGKRTSQEFLLALDDRVRSLIDSACWVHNGGRKTLDAAPVGFVSGKGIS